MISSRIRSAADALFSPGTQADGTGFAGCATTGGESVVINEIHYDPALDITGDANGDGFRSATEDEFVEIVNTSGGELDISGWQLLDGVGLRHTFPAGTVLANECSVVVFGGGTPTGGFGRCGRADSELRCARPEQWR